MGKRIAAVLIVLTLLLTQIIVVADGLQEVNIMMVRLGFMADWKKRSNLPPEMIPAYRNGRQSCF